MATVKDAKYSNMQLIDSLFQKQHLLLTDPNH